MNKAIYTSGNSLELPSIYIIRETLPRESRLSSLLCGEIPAPLLCDLIKGIVIRILVQVCISLELSEGFAHIIVLCGDFFNRVASINVTSHAGNKMLIVELEQFPLLNHTSQKTISVFEYNRQHNLQQTGLHRMQDSLEESLSWQGLEFLMFL